MDHIKDKFHQLIAHFGVVTGTELALYIVILHI